MKTINRLILKSYAGPMVLTFFIVVFIMVMQFLWLYIDEFVGKGLGFSFIGELIFWVSVTTIPMALPLSTLLASIMTMGDMGESNELLALKSAGISLQRVMRPLLLLVFAISMLAFYVSNNLLPLSNLKMKTMLEDIKRKRPDVSIEEGIFTTTLPGFAIKVGKKNPDSGLLKDIMIYEHREQAGNTNVTIADSGYIHVTKDGKYILVTLFSGNTYQDEKSTNGGVYPFSHRQFSKQEMLVDLSDWNRTDESMFKGASQMLSLGKLDENIDSLKKTQEVATEKAVAFYVSTAAFSNIAELDTAQASVKQLVHSINVDSLYNAYSKEQKATVVTDALAKAEGARTQMSMTKDELELRRKQIAQSIVDWHLKFTLPVACLIFFFIGAPLGAIIRKGGIGMPMVVSIFLFIIYWVMFSTAKKMAIQGSWNPSIAMWIPSFILLPLGIFLTYKATTDSALFNASGYFDFFKKLFVWKKNAYINPSEIKSVYDGESVQVSKEKVLRSLHSVSGSCDIILQDHFSSRNIWTAGYLWLEDRKEWLIEFEQSYNGLLSVLVLNKEDEQFHSILREYPVLKHKHYIYKGWEVFLISLAMLVTPLNIYLAIRAFYRRKQLKNILKEIKEVNRKVEDYIEHKNNE